MSGRTPGTAGGAGAVAGVPEGELVGVMGPNGSGKTTLFNLIAGALRPDAGQIRFAGHPIGGLAPHRVCGRGVARTFQLVRAFAGLSARENVLVGRLAVAPGSEYVDRPLGDTRARTLTGCSIVAVVRGEHVVTSPSPQEVLRADDVLVAIGSGEGLDALAARLAAP